MTVDKYKHIEAMSAYEEHVFFLNICVWNFFLRINNSIGINFVAVTQKYLFYTFTNTIVYLLKIYNPFPANTFPCEKCELNKIKAGKIYVTHLYLDLRFFSSIQSNAFFSIYIFIA